jgi:hypothetical protein
LSFVASGSRALDLAGRIWSSLELGVFFLLLWWLEQRWRSDEIHGISANKVGCSYALVLGRGTRWSLGDISLVLPWWEDGEKKFEAGFCNKRLQLLGFGLMAILLFSAGLGGEGEEGIGGATGTAPSWRCEASAHGDKQQRTSDGEHHLASASYGRKATLLGHGVVAVLPPGCRPNGRIFLGFLAGSIAGDAPSGLFPGGDDGARAWMLLECGGEGQGLDCFSNFCLRVFSAKCVPLSANTLYLRGMFVSLYPPLCVYV